MNELIKDWALTRLERFAIYVCSMAIAFCSWMMWENYKTNQKLTVMLEAIQKSDARQDQAIAEIKGQMVGWDTLKRIELFLGSQSPEKRGEMLGNAIRMERESRDK
jgi:hypothetical protein